MAKQTINLGTGELTGDGESIRSAFDKVNDNFDELYAKDATDFDGSYNSLTDKPAIPTAIDLSAVGESIIPDTDVTYDLGSADKRFRDLYLSGSSIDLGGTVISVAGGVLQIGGTSIADVARAAVADGSTGFNYGEVDGTSEIGVTADIFDFGDGKTIDMQNSSILLNGSTITGPITVDGSGSLIQTVTEGDASAIGGIAYSYNGVSIGVTANPEGEFNTEQSTVQVSSGEITLTSTAQTNGDPQYTSTGQLRVTPSNFRISLAPNTSWQGELTFDENEFRIPSDTIVGEGATLRLNNMSDISIPNEKGLSTFNLSIVNHPQYDYSISAINGNVISVTHFGGYPDPQVDWVMYDPNSNSTTAHPVIDVVAGAPGVWDVTLADDGYDYSQLSQLILWDLDQQTDPHQVSINSDGDLTGVTSINNVNTLTGVRNILGDAVDQWSYISSPTDNGTITNIAFGYFGEGGLQNIIYGSTSINEITVGPLGAPQAPLIRTLVSEENGLAIDLDISSGTSGDVSGHVTIGTGDVGTKGEIFLNAPVNVEGGTVRIDTTGSLLPATRITKEFIEFQGASQLSMPYDFGISKLSIDIATAEALSLSVSSETVNGGETTWSGVSPDIDPFFDLSTAIGWVYTDVNGVNHVITGASDVDQDNLWDVVFATNPDLTTEYGPGAWGGIRIWNPENVDPNTRSVQIDYDGVLTGISEIVDLQRINTSYLNYDGSIQIGSASSGAAIQLAHSKLQIFAVPPTTSKGAAGDFLGQVAFDANYIYYCTTAYSGPSEVAATNYFDVTDGNGHYVQADVTTPSILGTGSLSVTNVMVSGVPSTEEVTSYELISGSTYRFFLANTAEPWNTLSTSRLEISPNIWKRVAWSSDTW